MSKYTKVWAGAVLAGSLAVGPVAAASAVTTVPDEGPGVTIGASTRSTSANAGGGSWGWGISGNTVFSDYNHPSRCHGSTAIGKNTVRVTGKPKNVVSKARASKKSSGNQAFYHFC